MSSLVFSLTPPIFRRRSLWRRRAPVSAGEIRRIERWLATARVLLAACALVAVLMNAGGIRYSVWAGGLLAFYLAQGVIIILLLRRRQQSTLAFRLLVYGGDIVWPALISLFASGEGNPFFLFFVFVLAAAAYRWGLWRRSAPQPRHFSSCGLRAWLFILVLPHGQTKC